MAAVEPCDSIGSPAQHQEVTVVSCIVHTDEKDENFRRVKIPAFVPLFVRQEGGNPMTTDGVAHVELIGDAKNFIGISMDTFVAHAGRESTNFISVAIAGAVTVATPDAIFNKGAAFGAGPGPIPYLGKYIGSKTKGLRMTYEDSECIALTANKPNQYPFGTYLGHIDPAYDGIRAFLRSVPQVGEIVAYRFTGSDLGEEEAAAPVATPVRRAPPKKSAPAESMFKNPMDEDNKEEDEIIGKKRSAASSAGAAPKKGSKKKDV